MTKQPATSLFTEKAETNAKAKTRLTPRLRRFAAVLGLCVIVTPISGFWVDVNDDMRGISAVRMRIDYTAEAAPAKTAKGVSAASFALSSGPELPLSLSTGAGSEPHSATFPCPPLPPPYPA